MLQDGPKWPQVGLKMASESTFFRFLCGECENVFRIMLSTEFCSAGAFHGIKVRIKLGLLWMNFGPFILYAS